MSVAYPQTIKGSFKIWGVEEAMSSERLIRFLNSRHKYSMEEAKAIALVASRKDVAVFRQKSPVIKDVKIFKLK